MLIEEEKAAAAAEEGKDDPSRWTDTAIDFGKPKFTPDWKACAHIILMASHVSVPEVPHVARVQGLVRYLTLIFLTNPNHPGPPNRPVGERPGQAVLRDAG